LQYQFVQHRNDSSKNVVTTQHPD